MKFLTTLSLSCAVFLTSINIASADDYLIDTRGGHAAINFKFKHLGISWLLGEFKTFEGTFKYDPDNIAASSVIVDIDTTSLDSNHAERDKHIRSEDFLDVDKYPTAKFISTSVVDEGENKMTINGDLTLHGITKPIVMQANITGEGETPWKDYRIGLEATTTINTEEFGMSRFGPENKVYMHLFVEGIRQ